jgi:predicted Zn-dependent protease
MGLPVSQPLKTAAPFSPFSPLFLGFVIAIWLSALAPGQAIAQRSEADIYVAQAILAYDDKRYEEALKFLREALAIDQNNVEAFYYMGLVYNAQQKPAEAAQALEKAFVQSPSDPVIQYHLGVTYFILQRYDKAEPLLIEVFSVQPQKDNLGYYVGFMRYRRKDYEGAVQAFSKGVATDPDIQQLTRFYSGLALAILGRPAQAAGELEEASRIRTVSPLTGPADRLRDTMLAAQERERRLHAELRFGAYYDTNVSINPLSSCPAPIRSCWSCAPGAPTRPVNWQRAERSMPGCAPVPGNRRSWPRHSKRPTTRFRFSISAITSAERVSPIEAPSPPCCFRLPPSTPSTIRP